MAEPGSGGGGGLPSSAFGMAPLSMGPPKDDNDSDTTVVGTGKAPLDPAVTRNGACRAQAEEAGWCPSSCTPIPSLPIRADATSVRSA